MSFLLCTQQRQGSERLVVDGDKTYTGSSVSFNGGHDATDVICKELNDGRVIRSLQHLQYNVLQRRPTLLIGQSTLVVVIETICHVQ